jgi:hypothetical protein
MYELYSAWIPAFEGMASLRVIPAKVETHIVIMESL